VIKRQTVLILGAGASMHLKFPSGRDLVTLVVDGLRNEAQDLCRLLRTCGYSSQQLTTFRDALQRSGRPSVDVFLEHRPEFVPLGKTAIAALLTPFESEASLFATAPSWYSYLFAHLGPSLNEVRQSKLSVVTFNYDRSFEHYLFTALQNSFKLTTAQALEHFDHSTGATVYEYSIPIVHVYGNLGALPYVGGVNARPYEPPQAGELPGVAHAVKESIKIMHEGGANNLALGRASQLIREADVICFLGFGYLEENLKRLRLDRRKRDAVVWGSAYGLGHGERVPVEAFFAHGNVGRPIGLGTAQQDTLEFLRQHPVFA
jgi:hypothetical protein